MKLTAAAQAHMQAQQAINQAILLYGPSKSGKTRLVATAAKVPEVENIYWFDGENGIQTILNMGLTEEELAKFTVYKIPDTRDNPRFIETLLKGFTTKGEVNVCDKHGAVGCKACGTEYKTTEYPGEKFNLQKLTNRDVVVIDSGSQLGTSAINYATFGKPVEYKLLQDDWGAVRKYLTDIMLVIQQCANTNFVMITHELLTEGVDGKERIYPLIGTKAFCAECSKFFGTVIYTSIELGKHKAGSSSTYKSNVITGSRANVSLESIKDASVMNTLIPLFTGAGGVVVEPTEETKATPLLGSKPSLLGNK